MRNFILLFLFLTASINAQHRVNGIIKDSKTKKPLAFATIASGNTVSGISDVDGKFSITLDTGEFTVSYVGYEPQDFRNDGRKFFTIFLSQKTMPLGEATVSSVNPANEIIRNAIRNKPLNDPQKKLKSFEFKAYNRLLLTADPDSIEGKIENVNVSKIPGIKNMKPDSAQFKFKRTILRQHLFHTEKVSEYQFNGDYLKETILGTKMSGFSQPVYEILGFNLQSFSIYDEKYELLETKYNSPIANDALKDYHFRLLDTVEINGRKTQMIYFRNKKRSRKAGLEGVLYIDSQNFAIARAVTRIKGVLDISGTHEFTYLPDQDIWFPTIRNFKILKGNNDADIRILGETIRFDAVSDNPNNRKKEVSDYTYIISETNYSDIRYNQPVTISKPLIAIEIRDEAINREESFWHFYRKDSLDLREKNTYHVLDSLVTEGRYDKKLRLGLKVINGYVPFGPVDLDLRYLLSYNNYEGFRVGLGGVTNERFSSKYRLEGYTAYGTKDGNFKYNLGGAARIGKFSATWIGASYTDDVREIASTSFAIDKRVFKLYDPRPINVSTFYHHLTRRVFLETKLIPGTESIWQITQSLIEPKFNYIYNLDGRLYEQFNMTTAMVSMQWNPFSDYMQTPVGRVEVEKRFPKFTFQITKSLPDFIGNDFDFAKLDFRAEYQKKYLNGQKSAILFEAGYAHGDIPLTHLYNTSPNNLTKDRLIQRITFAGKDAFETMYFNEFFSSQYAMLQLKHGSKRITLFRKVRPSLVLVTRMAWGNLQKPEQHVGIDYKTLDKGYFESGIELNQIYQGLGLSGFYRYGPNQLPRFEDNLSVKISFIINLGI